MAINFGFSFNDGDTINALRVSKLPKKPIVGTPWYQVLSNPKYKNDFGFISINTSERYKLIEDGQFDKDENDVEYSEEIIRRRNEQSDLVMILLNLGNIPDAVVNELTHFDNNWSVDFKEAMDRFSERPEFNDQMQVRQELIDEHLDGDYK